MNPYLALLRVEFTVPRTVTSRAVRSYRTLSPLPDPLTRAIGGLLSVALVVGFPGRYGTLPYGARTFLPSARLPEEDDDEAATVWSASARSIEGLRALVTPRCAFQSPVSRRYYVKHGRYCHKLRGVLRLTYQCWSVR